VHDVTLDGAAHGGARIRCEVDNAGLDEVLRRLTASGVRTLTCRPPTLEELFLRQYAGQDGEAAVRQETQAP
jgi:ABC-2 type transport system ATP-binding protein